MTFNNPLNQPHYKETQMPDSQMVSALNKDVQNFVNARGSLLHDRSTDAAVIRSLISKLTGEVVAVHSGTGGSSVKIGGKRTGLTLID